MSEEIEPMGSILLKQMNKSRGGKDYQQEIRPIVRAPSKIKAGAPTSTTSSLSEEESGKSQVKENVERTQEEPAARSPRPADGF